MKRRWDEPRPATALQTAQGDEMVQSWVLSAAAAAADAGKRDDDGSIVSEFNVRTMLMRVAVH
jgi:hypothetical protein